VPLNKSYLKVVVVNAAIFLALIVPIELTLGDWWEAEPYNLNETYCFNAITHHFSCPSMRTRRFLSSADGGAVINIYTDKLGIPVASAEEMDRATDTSQFDVVNIGDSFMQAQQIDFKQQLSQQMRRLGVNAFQVGYSSWAPIVELNWLRENKLKRGVHINLFLMTNDFIPNDWGADINYQKDLATDVADPRRRFKIKPALPVSHSLSASIRRRSFIISRAENLWTNLKAARNAPKETTPSLTTNEFGTFNEDCAALANYQQAKATMPYYLVEYLTFSRPSKCWPSEAKTAVDYAITNIRKIRDLVTSNGGTLTALLIPTGFAFPNENMIGKASPLYYGIAPKATITQAGLARYLSAELPTIDFVDLEEVIREMKRNDSEPWYFPADGHWTPYAQRKLAAWLTERPQTRR
jgi:hypothetical protein